MKDTRQAKKEKSLNLHFLKCTFLGSCLAISCIAIFISSETTHDENSLMNELGPPPPWPVFTAVNFLANFFRNIADNLTPPQITMLDFGFSHQKLALPYVIQKYKIADFIGTGPKSVDQIAVYLSIPNVKYVERFMYACAAIGLFKLEDERIFVNSKLSAVLRRDHPNSMAAWIGHHYEVGLKVWSNFHHMFDPNEPDVLAWNLAFPDYIFDPPKQQIGIYKMFNENPAQEEQFGRMMEALEGVGGYAMAADGPFEHCSRFIDIGGSRGHFLTKLLRLYGEGPKEVTGVLFDVTSVINIAREVFDPVLVKQQKVQFVAGDFFNQTTIPMINDGDCIYLRYILHDWGDNEAKQILNNIRLSIGNKKATLLIGECAMPDRDVIGTPSAVHSVDMEMLAYFGEASERYPSYWNRLLEETKFEMKAVHQTRSMLAWVEVSPV